MLNRFGLLLLVLLSAPSCLALTLSSPAFNNNSTIPAIYTCDGKDISPPLMWNDVPENTRAFALVITDPDAPHGIWSHWLIWNIPANTTQLEENQVDLPAYVVTGKNSWNVNKYQGPCPPSGQHRYIFTLYALNAVLPLTADVDIKAFNKTINAYTIANAKLVGKYQRIK